MQIFKAANADAVWCSAAACLLDGQARRRESRAGPVIEELHAVFAIEEPAQRWVVNRIPSINPAFAIAEAAWILAGRSDAAFLNFWNPALPRYAGHEPNYAGAYGGRLRSGFGMDQVARALDALHANPDSRQVVLQIWDPARDLPGVDGGPASADVPCNLGSILKVRDGKLFWTQTMRSNDLLRGTPYNFVQFTILQEYMAGCLGLEIGEYLQISDSLHVYVDDLTRFRAGSSPPPPSRVGLALPRPQAELALRDFVARLDVLADRTIGEAEFERAARPGLPGAYGDFLAIASADAARRRGWHAAQDRSALRCEDEQLHLAWRNWKHRQASRSSNRAA